MNVKFSSFEPSQISNRDVEYIYDHTELKSWIHVDWIFNYTNKKQLSDSLVWRNKL